MKKVFFIILISFAINHTNCAAQSLNMADYNGDWESMIHPKAFSHQVTIEILENNNFEFSVSNYKPVFKNKLASRSSDSIAFNFAQKYSFTGRLNEQKDEITGVIKARDLMYNLVLKKGPNGLFIGKWNMLYVDEFNPGIIYLAVENGKGDQYEAYPIFADSRFRGTYVFDFQKKGNRILFHDHNTGLDFKGELLDEKINIDVMMGSALITTLQFSRSENDWRLGTDAKSPELDVKNPIQKNDGLETGKFDDSSSNFSTLSNIKDSVKAETLTHVHSVLVAHKNKLVYEQYFDGFNADIPHDTRSAAKSIGSAMVGIAINEGIFESVKDGIYNYIPEEYQYTKNAKNEKITIEHLLTMSSGMDAIDFGTDRQGLATEDAYQQSDNWLKTVLEAPMIYEAGEHCNYGSANPYLLGVAMANEMEQPLENYMKEKIYAPLSIENYTMFLDDRGDPYFGGGTYLLPRDMMKFGLLYANKGNWKGEQLVPEKWVEESFKNYMILENTNDKNGYGYLFWHQQYEVNGKKINSVEARGAGGQYIAMINDLDLVIVITSGNYRNGRFWQPEMIIEDYILPCFVK